MCVGRKSGHLKFRGSGWRGAVFVIAIRTVATTFVCVGCCRGRVCVSWFDVCFGSSGGTLEFALVVVE